MKKTLVALALTALPGLMLSACNSSTGGAGVAALPNAPAASHGRMHRNDNGPQDLHAGGSTFPAYAYNQANQPVGYYNQAQQPPGSASLFYKAPTVGTIYYCLTGSGDGRKRLRNWLGFRRSRPPARARRSARTPTGSDGRQDPSTSPAATQAMTSSEYTNYKAEPQAGQPSSGASRSSSPTIGGPITFGYRPKDMDVKARQVLYLDVLRHLERHDQRLERPAITADNGGKSVTGGVSQPITFYFRSDSSGTSTSLHDGT